MYLAETLQALAVAPVDHLLGVNVDTTNLGYGLVQLTRREDAVRRIVGEDKPERGLAGAVAGDAHAASGGDVAGGERRVVELEPGWLIVSEFGIQTAAVLTEDFVNASGGAARDVGDLGPGGSWEGMEPERSVYTFADVDAVQAEDVHMHVQPEGAVDAMHRRDGPSVRVPDAG